jgi:hypothetical protein
VISKSSPERRQQPAVSVLADFRQQINDFAREIRVVPLSSVFHFIPTPT